MLYWLLFLSVQADQWTEIRNRHSQWRDKKVWTVLVCLQGCSFEGYDWTCFIIHMVLPQYWHFLKLSSWSEVCEVLWQFIGFNLTTRSHQTYLSSLQGEMPYLKEFALRFLAFSQWSLLVLIYALLFKKMHYFYCCRHKVSTTENLYIVSFSWKYLLTLSFLVNVFSFLPLVICKICSIIENFHFQLP